MHHGKTHYTESLGIPELQARHCEHYKKTYGVTIDAECIVVTAGSSPALLMAISCLVDAGDEVIMTDPYYACYPNFVKVLGARPHLVRTGSSDRFQLDPAKVKQSMSGLDKGAHHQLAGQPHRRLS